MSKKKQRKLPIRIQRELTEIRAWLNVTGQHLSNGDVIVSGRTCLKLAEKYPEAWKIYQEQEAKKNSRG